MKKDHAHKHWGTRLQCSRGRAHKSFPGVHSFLSSARHSTAMPSPLMLLFATLSGLRGGKVTKQHEEYVEISGNHPAPKSSTAFT